MKDLIHTITRSVRTNSPIIMSSTAIAGVVTTAYLASRASVQANRKLERFEAFEVAYDRSRKERVVDAAKLTWKLYIPTVISGGVTVGCIIGTTRINNKRIAAAQAAFVISERAYSEYRNKVVEEYGERKDQGFRDSIAADRVMATPPPTTMIVGQGQVICCELYTMRYFQSDMETLRRAVNDVNAQLLRHDQVTLDDLYHLIGLPGTSVSGDIGWYSDRQLEFEFTSVLDDNGRPCLAFEYNYTKPLFEGLYKY